MMSDKKAKAAQSQLAIGTLRSLIIDMTNNASSGHPGMAIDIAPAMYALYRDHLVANPADPSWWGRDRLVYSSGHNSALAYALLHLAGYALSIDDLKSFRKLGSITPGHPEVGLTPGIDVGAGPLAQGIGQAVGLALAEKMLLEQFEGLDSYFGHHTYCLCGDGCLQEGLSQEAISLAGHFRLNKLILIYDENGSTLDGPTSDTLSENIELRFLSSEWNVIKVNDGNDVEALSRALAKAKKSKDYPTLIIVKTQIGYGTKYQGSNKCHGSPLGEEIGNAAKQSYGASLVPFEVSPKAYDCFSSFKERGQKAYEEYKKGEEAYKASHPKEYGVLMDALNKRYDAYIPSIEEIKLEEKEATRTVSGKFLNALYMKMPFAIGGAADVASSVKTKTKDGFYGMNNPKSRDLNFGIREFGMACLLNGLSLHGGVLPYGGSFMVFVDYFKAAIRMAAMEKIQVIYALSHDSLAVGEDGMTHQPVEQLVSLRSIPNTRVYRPADGKETLACYKLALDKKDGPSCLILSRQNLPLLDSSSYEKCLRGGYIVKGESKADIEILSSGSEVSLALEASKILEREGIKAAVVSIPCLELFASQEEKYQDEVLFLPREKRVSLEAGSTLSWGKWASHNIGVDGFGASGQAKEVMEAYGFSPDKVANRIKEMLK